MSGDLPLTILGPNTAELHVHDFAANTGDSVQLSRKMPAEHFRKALMATFGNIFRITKITIYRWSKRLKVTYNGYTRPLHKRRHFD